jgi:hypothetical protein
VEMQRHITIIGLAYLAQKIVVILVDLHQFGEVASKIVWDCIQICVPNYLVEIRISTSRGEVGTASAGSGVPWAAVGVADPASAVTPAANSRRFIWRLPSLSGSPISMQHATEAPTLHGVNDWRETSACVQIRRDNPTIGPESPQSDATTRTGIQQRLWDWLRGI